MLGLVMTAGGARGAYQAGVLKRLGELPAFRRRASPFRIIAGASAGAINGATVAALSGNFYDATRALAQLWADLRVPDVFRADAVSLSLNGLRLLQDLLLGGEDLAIVARHLSHRMPRLVRYLMDGLGTPDAQSADLMSYLLFDSAYTRALVDIGYRDAGARIDEIENFLVVDSPQAEPAVRSAPRIVPVVA